MAKKSLAKKAPKETSKKAASNAPAPFDAKNLAHTAIFEHAEKRDHVGSFISVEFDDENRVATYLFNANLAGYKGWRWCVTRRACAIWRRSARPTTPSCVPSMTRWEEIRSR